MKLSIADLLVFCCLASASASIVDTDEKKNHRQERGRIWGDTSLADPRQFPYYVDSITPSENPSDTSPLSAIFIGCFVDEDVRDLPEEMQEKLTTDECLQACRNGGYTFAGRQYYDQCWCGDNVGKYGSANDCGDGCLTQTGFFGGFRNCVFRTSSPTSIPSDTFSPTSIETRTDTFSPTINIKSKCAKESKRAKECGAKGGRNTCCPGLACHHHQYWRCVQEKHKSCSGPFTFSKSCGSNYVNAAPACCPGLICVGKKCVAKEQTTCAEENERSRYCGADYGEDMCCNGLVCHVYQSWKCVQEKNKECAGPGTYAKQCGSYYKKASPECCDGLTCNDKKCVSPSYSPSNVPTL